ncbi:MAG: hypothetical protein CMJ49_02750 [Planctomycetaceae bacterium]|nr:hypothetical protein [Planctomycetaceae bacterium]
MVYAAPHVHPAIAPQSATAPPPLPIPGTPDPASPLTETHLQQLADAKTRARKIRRAAAIAAINGWTIGAFAALTALSALFSFIALPLAIGMGLVAWFEIQGSRQLKQLDPTAPRRLALNQIGFALLLTAYAVYQLIHAAHAPSPYAQYTDGASAGTSGGGGEMAAMLGPIEDLTRIITLAVYITLIVFALTVPTLTALYYFTRAHHLRSYLAQTPDWVVKFQRSAA